MSRDGTAWAVETFAVSTAVPFRGNVDRSRNVLGVVTTGSDTDL
jgi:hypothetical protein